MIGTPLDVLPWPEAYHLLDPLAPPLSHDRRFDADRLPAIVELCIQAGADVSGYPTVRQDDCARAAAGRSPHASAGMGRSEHDTTPARRSGWIQLTGCQHAAELVLESRGLATASSKEAVAAVAEQVLEAWEQMRAGVAMLLGVDRAQTCGYCPEVHIGRRGHQVRSCWGSKQQRRQGRHGWQPADVDDLVPRKIVWRGAPPGMAAWSALAPFLGTAPAVVELCVQAGAAPPAAFAAAMQLDVVLPDVKEAAWVV
eukprot:SM000020S06075  [mRNA]  locus=s20:949923:951027:+ [translate_table: standard]